MVVGVQDNRLRHRWRGEPREGGVVKSQLVNRETIAKGVVALTLNRPDKLNAFSRQLRNELRMHLADLGPDLDGAAVVVLRGAGRAFSVGADVGTSEGYNDVSGEEDRLELLESAVSVPMAIWEFPRPVIAQLHGYCFGIATILANACDLVITSEDCRIGWPKLPLGAGLIGPTWIPYVGIHRAKELSYTIGSEMTGAVAAAYEFANRAVPAAELENEVLRTAQRIAQTPADLLQIKKTAMNRVVDGASFTETLELGAAWDALSHTAEGVQRTRALMAERGLKGAIASFGSVEEDGGE